MLYTSPGNIWKPDFYLTNSVTNTYGGTHDGELLRIMPDGSIFWSQRIRARMACTMDFWYMPGDSQNCPLYLSLYGTKADQAVIQWRLNADGELEALELSKNGISNTEWSVCSGPMNSTISWFSSGGYSEAEARLILTRKDLSLAVFAVAISVFFVMLAYTGFFISPAAAPARVALGFLCFLMVLNNLNVIRSALPRGLEPSKSWLLLFMFVSLVFNFGALLEYGCVNYGMQVDAENKRKAELSKKLLDGSGNTSANLDAGSSSFSAAAKKAVSSPTAKVGQDASAPKEASGGSADLELIDQITIDTGVRQDGSTIRAPPKPAKQKIFYIRGGKPGFNHAGVAKLKDLDSTCRWLFPLLFLITFIVMIIVGETHPSANKSKEYASLCVAG